MWDVGKMERISYSKGNASFLIFFLFHWLHLHMIFMQSFLKHCAVFENELNSESFSLYYFSPGNCTNPLSISLFPRGWVIYCLDPAGQISKSLTQNEQPSLFLWVMGREFEIMVRVLKNGAKQEKKSLIFFPLDISYGSYKQKTLFFPLPSENMFFIYFSCWKLRTFFKEMY